MRPSDENEERWMSIGDSRARAETSKSELHLDESLPPPALPIREGPVARSRLSSQPALQRLEDLRASEVAQQSRNRLYIRLAKFLAFAGAAGCIYLFAPAGYMVSLYLLLGMVVYFTLLPSIYGSSVPESPPGYPLELRRIYASEVVPMVLRDEAPELSFQSGAEPARETIAAIFKRNVDDMRGLRSADRYEGKIDGVYVESWHVTFRFRERSGPHTYSGRRHSGRMIRLHLPDPDLSAAELEDVVTRVNQQVGRSGAFRILQAGADLYVFLSGAAELRPALDTSLLADPGLGDLRMSLRLARKLAAALNAYTPGA